MYTILGWFFITCACTAGVVFLVWFLMRDKEEPDEEDLMTGGDSSAAGLERRKLWVDAAAALSESLGNKVYADFETDVVCPDCGNGKLVVHDVLFDDDPTQGERWLSCTACRAWVAIRSAHGYYEPQRDSSKTGEGDGNTSEGK
ncbi:MAG: hypothetical protein LBR29_09330 [Methylobacteriaceae bacterium]|nr:hypothetical protein [Methylobacteriaceae bacterium]